MSYAFSSIAWRAVWDSLDDATKEDIEAKARWERMTLSGVMLNWWPDLWQRLQDHPASQALDAKLRGPDGMSDLDSLPFNDPDWPRSAALWSRSGDD